MLHILGMIGKGIGITLLCILILVIVLLFAVLFVPIRYRAAGKKAKEGLPEGSVRISWLFHAVHCFAIWEGKLHYGLKLFGILVYDNWKKKEKKEKERKNKKRKRQKKKSGNAEQDPVLGETTAVSQRESAEQKPESFRQKQERQENSKEQEEDIACRPGLWTRLAEKLQALLQKIKCFFRMLGNLFRKIAELPRTVYEKTEHWKQTVSYYIALVQRDEWKHAFALCSKQILGILRSIRPRTVRADVWFGFEDPSVTGQILAIAGMVYPILGKNMILRPDFEEKVFCGELLVKGRVTVFVLLKALWILYFDKDIKRLIRIWKKEETLHGRQ